MSREEQDVLDMICWGSEELRVPGRELDPKRLAQLLTDYEARIAALETELEQAKMRKEGV